MLGFEHLMKKDARQGTMGIYEIKGASFQGAFFDRLEILNLYILLHALGNSKV